MPLFPVATNGSVAWMSCRAGMALDILIRLSEATDGDKRLHLETKGVNHALREPLP